MTDMTEMATDAELEDFRTNEGRWSTLDCDAPILEGFAHRMLARIEHEVAERKRLQGIIDAHELCHDQHGKVGAEEFATSCANEQRKLFGCAPHADRIERLEEEVATLRAEVRALRLHGGRYA